MPSALALKPTEQSEANPVDLEPRPAHDHRQRLRVLLTPEERLARWGTTSVSPFTLGANRVVQELRSGGFIGVQVRRHWGVMASDPIAPPGKAGDTIDDALERLADHRVRPVFAAVADAEPYRDRGLWTTPIADDALIDVASFTLAGKRMSSIRHSVSAAIRAGLTIAPWSSTIAPGASDVSGKWLATKRGGELGFTLGRFDPAAMAGLDCRVAIDASGRVVGLVTWHSYDDGRARVLDLMRRTPDAPNPTMDLLIADSLRSFAEQRVGTVSLGCVPRSHGRLAERIYPTASLRRYKNKFAPEWVPRHLVAPSSRHAPGAFVAVAHAYCPSGLMAAIRPNR